MSFLHIPPKLKPYLTRNFARTEWMRYRRDHNREWFRAVSAIIHLDIGGGNVISSTISIESVKELDLAVGKEAYAIIKATSVMVGVE